VMRCVRRYGRLSRETDASSMRRLRRCCRTGSFEVIPERQEFDFARKAPATKSMAGSSSASWKLTMNRVPFSVTEVRIPIPTRMSVLMTFNLPPPTARMKEATVTTRRATPLTELIHFHYDLWLKHSLHPIAEHLKLVIVTATSTKSLKATCRTKTTGKDSTSEVHNDCHSLTPSLRARVH
jgi:hypothetical protein